MGTGITALSSYTTYMNRIELHSPGVVGYGPQSEIVFRDTGYCRWTVFVTTAGVVSAVPA